MHSLSVSKENKYQGGSFMLKHWLENEPKVTLVCAVLWAVSLVLSITGVLKDVLPVDIAWIAIVLCGIPILIGAFKGVIFEHDIKAVAQLRLGVRGGQCGIAAEEKG